MHCLFNMTRTKELQKVSLELIREVGDMFSGVLKRNISESKAFSPGQEHLPRQPRGHFSHATLLGYDT